MTAPSYDITIVVWGGVVPDGVLHQDEALGAVMLIRMTGCVLATTAFITTAAVSSERFSMTGTYEGVLACDSVSNGLLDGFSTPGVLKIIQRGSSEISLELKYGDEDDPTICLYEGATVTDRDGDAVGGYFEACGGTFVSTEVARIFPATRTEDGFNFAADTVFHSTDIDDEGTLLVQGCKFAFTRVDRNRPRIQTCD